MPTFDVIVPIYRVEPELVAECLASIRNQTHEDWICWVVDGTPPEWESAVELSRTIDAFVESDDRFRAVRQDFEVHPGVSGARNQGASLGDSPWIAFLDGDDWWFPENLSWLSEDLESAHTDTVVAWTASKVTIELTSANGWSHTSDQVASHFDLGGLRQDLGHGYWFLMGHPPMTSQVAVRRDRFDAVGGFDVELQMAEDTECWIRMLGSPARPPPSDSIRSMPSAVSTVSATTRPSTAVSRPPHPSTRPIPTLPIDRPPSTGSRHRFARSSGRDTPGRRCNHP